MLASTLTNINDLYSHIQDISDITASTNRLAVAYAPLTFPVLVISMPENPNFFGRKDTLKRMHEHLHSAEQQGLRCYTLYGMGGGWQDAGCHIVRLQTQPDEQRPREGL